MFAKSHQVQAGKKCLRNQTKLEHGKPIIKLRQKPAIPIKPNDKTAQHKIII